MTSFKSNAAYQRRQGGLSENQAHLIANGAKLIEVDALPTLIQSNHSDRPTILEIGFGTGDHLIQQAQLNPHADFIGIDLYLLGVACLLQKAEKSDLSNLWVLSTDAYVFLTTPTKTLNYTFNKIYILHPDPWPKKRHHKRRLLNINSLTGAYQLLKPGGSIEILSDEASYTESIITDVSERFQDQYSISSPILPKTKYGLKAIQEGRVITKIVISR